MRRRLALLGAAAGAPLAVLGLISMGWPAYARALTREWGLVEPAEATDNRGEVSFQITAGTSTVPDATDIGGTYVEWRIVDVNGNPATIASTDARQFWAWLSRTVGLLPVDCYMGVALTGTTPGAAAGVANAGAVLNGIPIQHYAYKYGSYAYSSGSGSASA
mgnify:CR=1 FL=1